MRYFLAVLLLQSACLSWSGDNSPSREKFAKAILAKVNLGNDFKEDTVELLTIRDAKSREPRQLCYLFGGPPTSTTGAIGVFDSTGRLLDANRVKGLYNYGTNASVVAEGDSVVFHTLDASGTGLHEESLIVLTLSEGKLRETFRCEGSRYSTRGEFYEQNVELCFRDLYGDRTPEIIRLVTSNRYSSNAAQENNQPSVTKKLANVFQFDPKAGKYVKAFE